MTTAPVATPSSPGRRRRRAATGRIEGTVRLVAPPGSADPVGRLPVAPRQPPAPHRASEIGNVVIFVKDARARRDAADRRARRCGRRMKRSSRASSPSRADRRWSFRTPIRTSTTSSRSPAARRSTSGAFPAARAARDLHAPGTGQGLLPPALADEREHHGVRPPALRRPRSRRRTSRSATCRRAAIASAPGTSGSARARNRSSSKRDGRSRSSSRCRWRSSDRARRPPRHGSSSGRRLRRSVMVAGVLTPCSWA